MRGKSLDPPTFLLSVWCPVCGLTFEPVFHVCIGLQFFCFVSQRSKLHFQFKNHSNQGVCVCGIKPGIAVLQQYKVNVCWSNVDIENYSFACWIFLYFFKMYYFLDGKITDFDWLTTTWSSFSRAFLPHFPVPDFILVNIFPLSFQ